MATTEWTHPVTEIKYKIGTEGWVFNDSGRPNNILDDARDSILAAFRTLFPGIGYIPSILVGWLAGDGAYCPTYGLWAGPGWANNHRVSKFDTINWDDLPCMNENITVAGADPDKCCREGC